MSRRETVLCDIELSNWNDAPVICAERAIGTCVLCKRDMCARHALHPKGGVLLRADSITPGTAGGNNQDIIWAPHAQQVMPYPQANSNSPMLRLDVCEGCRKLLQDNNISEALRAVSELFTKTLAAAISAKALETR